MADSQAPERNGRSESNLPERSALQTPSLSRECLRQLGFSAVLEMAERIWSGADWSRERNRDPTFSGRTEERLTVASNGAAGSALTRNDRSATVQRRPHEVLEPTGAVQAACISSALIAGSSRSLRARPSRKSTRFAAHHAISASRAKPESSGRLSSTPAGAYLAKSGQNWTRPTDA